MNTFELGILIRNALIEPEKKAFQQGIDSLIHLNKSEIEASNWGFVFNGSIYKKSNNNIFTDVYRSPPPLDFSLVSEMQELLKMFESSKREVQNIWQALLPLLVMSPSENALPDMLKNILPIRFNPRTASFEDILSSGGYEVERNWEVAEKQLHYLISLRLII
jgi:hypothetical protein